MIATAEMFRASAVPGRPTTMAERRTQAAALVLMRQVVTPVQLVESVNRQLAARGDCAGLEVEAGPLRPLSPDPDGCNWSAGALRVRVAHGASTRALAGVRQVVDWARLHYDLADSEAA
jgi:hypothetical protein